MKEPASKFQRDQRTRSVLVKKNSANEPPVPPTDERWSYAKAAGSAVGCAVSVAMIVVGAVGMDRCPVEPMIPTFLLGSTVPSLSYGFSVSGVIILLISGTKLVHALTMLAWSRGHLNNFVVPFEIFVVYFAHYFLVLVFLCWFIFGTVYVIGNFEPDYHDENSASYCDKDLFLFSFVFVCVTFLVGCVVTVFIFCMFCCTFGIFCLKGAIEE